jgi:hypothetical protein
MMELVWEELIVNGGDTCDGKEIKKRRTSDVDGKGEGDGRGSDTESDPNVRRRYFREVMVFPSEVANCTISLADPRRENERTL